MEKKIKNIDTVPKEKNRSGNIFSMERPISTVYQAIDNDIARDNLENHLSAADLQDL